MRVLIYASIVAVLMCASSQMSMAADGSITGVVRSGEDQETVRGARVRLDKSNRVAYTDKNGRYVFMKVTEGVHSLSFRAAGFADTTVSTATIDNAATVDVMLKILHNTFDAVVVYGAFKRDEKITETPAAVTAMSEEEIERAARGNQLGRALEGLTGVDVVQNGATDFNVNTRGFNNSTNRRLLVLVDGRDVGLQQIGATEWNSFATPLDEFNSIELVRGPAAALYGANAFNGVLNMRTLSPRESQGTKVSLLVGDYKTLRGDARHAGMFGDLAYKVTIGHSQSLNLAENRFTASIPGDSASAANASAADKAALESEYPSLWPRARENDSIRPDDRNTFSTYGTIRADYNLSDDQVMLAEFGYAEFGNEIMLAGAGRIHVPQTAKPFARLAYHQDHFHVQSTFNMRKTIDTMRILAAPKGTIILDDSYDINLDAQYNNNIGSEWQYNIGGQAQHMSIGSNGTVFPNDPIEAQIGGVYAQFEYKPMAELAFVASGRVDGATFHATQFSPRGAIVYTPVPGQQFRVSGGRSFQRPNFSELYRRYGFRPAFSAQGRPVNFRPIAMSIIDTLTALTGSAQSVDLGLFDPTVTSKSDPRGIQPAALGLGNEHLKVESNVGLELGYKGVIASKLFVTVDVYYNKLTDFISGFLPGVNPNFAAWSSKSTLSPNLQQYSGLVDSIVYAQLSPDDQHRLTTLDGRPTFVVSNANIGKVEQYGVEIGAEFLVTDNLRVNANYTYYGFRLIDAMTINPLLATGDQLLQPNTSPHRMNIGATYAEGDDWDVSAMFRYIEGFPWLAGDFRGFVPSYALLNLSAGVQVIDGLRIGVAMNNVLDRRHYEIYGGSIIPRLTYATVSYTF